MGLSALEEDGSLALGGYAVDLAGIACPHKEVASGVEGQRPDVLGLGVVENVCLAIVGNSIDLAIGRGSRVHAIIFVNRYGVDFDRLKLREGFLFSARRDAVQFGSWPASRIEAALGIARQRPEIGGRRVVQLFEARSQRQPPVAAK